MYTPLFSTDARKKNPYVGYFCAPEVPRPSCYIPGQSMKSSPYIGIFRHAPPEWQQHWKRIDESTMKKIERRSSNLNKSVAAHEHIIHINGRLAGGGKDDHTEEDSLEVSASLPVQSTSWLHGQVSKNHPVLKAYHNYQTRSLTNLYHIFERLNESSFFASISPFLNEFETIDSLQKAGADLLAFTGAAAVGGLGVLIPMIVRRLSLFNGEAENMSANCGSSCNSDNRMQVPLNETSDYETVSDINNNPSFDVSCAYEDQVSVLREARLDYVITQVDISRMARNASRHLDVESILALPTITFRSNGEKEGGKEGGGTNIILDEEIESENLGMSMSDTEMIPSSAIAGGWSWQMVTPSENEQDAEVHEVSESSEVNDNSSKEAPSCVICLESFRDGDTLRSLPCGHLFHVGCIDHWLLGTFSEDECFTSGCPTCKKRPTVETDDQSHDEVAQDGSVPAWAFARLGDAMVKESFG